MPRAAPGSELGPNSSNGHIHPLEVKNLKRLMKRNRLGGKGMPPEIQHKLKISIIKAVRDRRLVSASTKNNTDALKVFLAMGANPNSQDSSGRGALHIAASKGYVDVVQLLLEHGADPNKRDSLNNTPLHLAACIHHFPIITLLLNYGADVKALDMYGKNPYQLARGKLQLLHKNYKTGNVELEQVRKELTIIVDLLKAMLPVENNSHENVYFNDFEHMDPNRLTSALEHLESSLGQMNLGDDQVTTVVHRLDEVKL